MRALNYLTMLSILVLLVACSEPTCDQELPTDERLDYVDGNNVAMDGYDVTAFFTANKPVKGTSQFTSKLNGVSYYFASTEAKELFDKNPNQYIPQFGGYCAVAASFNKVEPVEIDLFDIYEGKLYFARNKKAAKMWQEDKAKIKQRAENLWPCLIIKNGRNI